MFYDHHNNYVLSFFLSKHKKNEEKTCRTLEERISAPRQHCSQQWPVVNRCMCVCVLRLCRLAQVINSFHLYKLCESASTNKHLVKSGADEALDMHINLGTRNQRHGKKTHQKSNDDLFMFAQRSSSSKYRMKHTTRQLQRVQNGIFVYLRTFYHRHKAKRSPLIW